MQPLWEDCCHFYLLFRSLGRSYPESEGGASFRMHYYGHVIPSLSVFLDWFLSFFRPRTISCIFVHNSSNSSNVWGIKAVDKVVPKIVEAHAQQFQLCEFLSTDKCELSSFDDDISNAFLFPLLRSMSSGAPTLL